MEVMSRRVAGFGTTVFVEINALARAHNAVNLGQGAPDLMDLRKSCRRQ
ncbi:MAG TPA: hypothetical protein VFV82_06065 [Candidatus Binatia bacterium]|nr:hypothetical protein [Candidatus Binatia bacterium]